MKPTGFLLDEHLSPRLPGILRKRVNGLVVDSLHEWANGDLVGQSDRRVIEAATRARRIFVTFDLNTVPSLLQEMAMFEEPHGGVVFISTKAIARNDLGGLSRALANLWHAQSSADWKNRIVFLSPNRGD